MPIILPTYGELNWHIPLNAALSTLDGNITSLDTRTTNLEGRAYLYVNNTQTMYNKTLVSPIINNPRVLSPSEKAVATVASASGTINYYASTQSVLYYTQYSTGTFTINFAWDNVTTLNSIMAVNDSKTLVFLNTNGPTTYALTGVSIDGTSVAFKWQGMVAPSTATMAPNGIDAYSFTIIKTANATFSVLVAQVPFA